MKPIPDNVKACLAELSASQQVTLKGYIATLRAELKEAEEQLRTAHDPDPHAHFHGDEKCTLDHGHDKEGDAHHHGKEEHDDCCGGHDEDHHKQCVPKSSHVCIHHSPPPSDHVFDFFHTATITSMVILTERRRRRTRTLPKNRQWKRALLLIPWT